MTTATKGPAVTRPGTGLSRGVRRACRGKSGDHASLMRLEAACFDPARRVSGKSVHHSLSSRHQEVWVRRDGEEVMTAVFLRFYPNTCRILSIAVEPAARGRGIGKSMLELAERRARARRCSRVHLEVDARELPLIGWYEDCGYRAVERLRDYYGRRRHAWRMRLVL